MAVLLNHAEAARYSPKPRPTGVFSYLRAGLYYVHVAAATLVLGLWGITQLPRGLIGANHVATTWIGYVLRAARWHMGIAVELRGTPPAPDQNALLAAKHQSFLDILAIAYAANRRGFVMKKQVLNVPVMGWYARRVGCIPIDRTRGRDAMTQIVSQAKARLGSDDGLGHLILYPEGTRTRPGEQRPYKQGIATIHIETSVPVYPVAVNCGMFWPKKGLPVAAGRAVIEFLPPISIEAGESRDGFMRRLRDLVETRSNALMAEAGLPIAADKALKAL